MGTRSTRLDGHRHRCGLGRHQGRGEPVAEAGTRGRRRSPAQPAATRPHAPVDRRPAGTASQSTARGAEAFGFIGGVWTVKRVAAIIRDEFHVRYHPDHVGRLLRTAGWSPQKPIRRATQRDEAAIQRWIAERWPALEAKPTRRAARLSGSMSRPSTRCQRWSAPGRPGARHLCYTRHSPAITCPSSVASRRPTNSSCRCESARCARRTWSASSSTCCGISPASC